LRALLRWAGSKRRLLNVLLSRVPPFTGRYVEPFAGSACLFFALEPTQSILGDVNYELMQAYCSIRRFPELIWSRLTALDDSETTYYDLRRLDPDALSASQRAIRFLYLNRFCFNGVYRTNRRGEFNVPRGRKTGSFPKLETFFDCSKLLKHASLKRADFEDTLREVSSGDFVYLDPPYFKMGREAYGEYGYNRFNNSDLDRFAAVLRSLDDVGARFLVSYSGSAGSQSLWSRWNVSLVEVRRHVAGFASARKNVAEVMVSNY
jgi:DNA adenine methylase